jgi:hypothetical protein
MRIKKIILAFYYNPNEHYVVQRVEHSTEFNPGTTLTKKQVDELVNDQKRWHVSIVQGK